LFSVTFTDLYKKYLTDYFLLDFFSQSVWRSFRVYLCSILVCEISFISPFCCWLAFGWGTVQIYRIMPNFFSKHLLHFVLYPAIYKISKLNCTLSDTEYCQTSDFSNWMNVQQNLTIILAFQLPDCHYGLAFIHVLLPISPLLWKCLALSIANFYCVICIFLIFYGCFSLDCWY
jgi:hypothetical protein